MISLIDDTIEVSRGKITFVLDKNDIIEYHSNNDDVISDNCHYHNLLFRFFYKKYCGIKRKFHVERCDEYETIVANIDDQLLIKIKYEDIDRYVKDYYKDDYKDWMMTIEMDGGYERVFDIYGFLDVNEDMAIGIAEKAFNNILY